MRVIRFIKNISKENGQANIEYIAVILVIALGVIVSLLIFSDTLVSMVFRMGYSVQQEKESSAISSSQKSSSGGDRLSESKPIKPPRGIEAELIAKDPNLLHNEKQFREALWKARINKYKGISITFIMLLIMALLLLLTYSRLQIIIRQQR